MKPINPLELFARAVRKLREWLESNEEENTRAAMRAHKERLAAIARNERWLADKARRRAERNARDLLLDDLSRIQRRARRSISGIDGVLDEAKKLQGEALQGWLRERKAKQLPYGDIEALRVEFRGVEALLCREEYRRLQLKELIAVCCDLKRELTRRSPYFKDAARFGAWMPEERDYRKVPADLPKRFDLIEGEARPVATGLYFALPAKLKGYLDDTEPAVGTLARGDRRPLHVRSVDYRRGEATVSVAAAKVIRAYERAADTTFKAVVTRVEASGARLLVGGRVGAFLPKSKWRGAVVTGQQVKVRLTKLDRYLDSPIALLAPDARESQPGLAPGAPLRTPPEVAPPVRLW